MDTPPSTTDFVGKLWLVHIYVIVILSVPQNSIFGPGPRIFGLPIAHIFEIILAWCRVGNQMVESRGKMMENANAIKRPLKSSYWC